MISIDRIQEILDEVAQSIPKEIYEKLNGGVVLSPDCKMDKKDGIFYIMGEYHRDRMMGRYVVIYGGSFQKLYEKRSEAFIRKKLEGTLKHELTHHVESLAGVYDLEIEDAIYKHNHRNRSKKQ